MVALTTEGIAEAFPERPLGWSGGEEPVGSRQGIGDSNDRQRRVLREAFSGQEATGGRMSCFRETSA
jgi:hypothetical protein